MQDKNVILENEMNVAEGPAAVTEKGALGHFALKSSTGMQSWQDRFCEMAGVYAMCLGADGSPLTEFSGNPHEIQIIRKYVNEIRIHNIFRRVCDSELEDQAVEITEVPNLRLAAVSVKSGKDVAAVWIVCGLFTDAEYDKSFYKYPPIDNFQYLISEDKFYKTLDLLRETLDILITVETSRSEAIAISKESRQQEIEMTSSFHRAETMTEIVSLLDSNDVIEEIMAEVLSKLCTYLQISNAFTCRMHHGNLMDIVVQWTSHDVSKLFPETTDQEACWFLGTQKAVVISSDTQMNAGEREQIENLGIKALVDQYHHWYHQGQLPKPYRIQGFGRYRL